jgi:mRNA interferase MazF
VVAEIDRIERNRSRFVLQARGHEQKGLRPAVVVSDSAVVRSQRYPMVAVVPLVSTPGRGALYPAIEPGRCGLQRRSYALVDQLRSVDKRRVIRAYGRVRSEEMERIEEGLRLSLGLA